MKEEEKHRKRLVLICDILLVCVIILIIVLSFKTYGLYKKYGWDYCIEERNQLTQELETKCFNTSEERNDYLEAIIDSYKVSPVASSEINADNFIKYKERIIVNVS